MKLDFVSSSPSARCWCWQEEGSSFQFEFSPIFAQEEGIGRSIRIWERYWIILISGLCLISLVSHRRRCSMFRSRSIVNRKPLSHQFCPFCTMDSWSSSSSVHSSLGFIILSSYLLCIEMRKKQSYIRSIENYKKTFTQSLHDLYLNIETKFLRFQLAWLVFEYRNKV